VTINLTVALLLAGLRASIVLLAGVCCLSVVVRRRRLSSSVTLPAGERAGRRALGRLGGRHCTAGQDGYVPLGLHFVEIRSKWTVTTTNMVDNTPLSTIYEDNTNMQT